MFSLIGSGRLYFKQGSVIPATVTDKTLYPFNLPEGTLGINLDVTSEDNEVPVAGVLQVDETVITKFAIKYSYKMKKFDMNIMCLLMGGPTPTDVATPPTTIAVASNLSHSGFGYMEWYKNGDAVGTPFKKHYGFSCQIVPNGELSMDPAKYSEASLDIKITSTKGTFA